MEKPLVSVIIVNWNGKKLLDDSLGSLLQTTYKKKEIIFVDNASADGSVEYVRKNYPSVKICQNEKNLGFAQGHEIGFLKSKGDAILILNTDTLVEKNLLDELVSALYSNRNIGAVQPKVLLYEKKHLLDSVGSFFMMSGDLYHFGRDKDQKLPLYNHKMDIFSAKGVCMLMKREVIEKAGLRIPLEKEVSLFDKDYFAYFEETDLCMRIWLAGYRITYVPATAIYHKGGGSSKYIHRSKMLFHSEKNRILTYIKNLSIKYMIPVLFNTIIMYELVFILYLLTAKFRYALSVQQAMWWNIVHLGETIQKRRYVQKYIRKVSDDMFLPHITKSVRPSYYLYQFLGRLDRYTD